MSLFVPRSLAVLIGSSLLSGVAMAQAGRVFTIEDYARAEARMPYKTSALVDHQVERVSWMPGGSFWFRDTANGVTTFMLVDAAAGTKNVAFDHAAMAKALTTALGRPVDAARLPISAITSADKSAVTVKALGNELRCSLAGEMVCASARPAPATSPKSGEPATGLSATGTGGNAQIKTTPAGQRDAAAQAAAMVKVGAEPAILSPDKKRAAFVRDWNLWVRDIATAAETQLTTDGIKDYGYATDNAGWSHSNKAILVWSPDSRQIATFQQDQRKDGEMYLVNTQIGHPHLEAWKYPLPGDVDVTMIERVVIDVATKKLVRLKMAPDQHRSTLCDDVTCRGGGWDDVQWGADAKTLAFVSTSRDHKQEWLRMADPSTGDVREVMQETVKTYFESGNGRVNWKYLSATNEILWFSERDNWGQLYLYDATNGKLKRQLTHGEGDVSQVLIVEQKLRTIGFLANGKEKGRDPYYSAFYSVNLDGGDAKLLTPEDADHAVTPSLDGHYFVDAYSTPTTPQVTVLRKLAGPQVLEVAKTDISRLKAAGWVPPVPVIVKARDGKTDLYGMLFKPTNFDATKKYPIVNYIYPGPQTGSVGSRSFMAARGDRQALADLGFVVVSIDGLGTPWRSKSFHDFWATDLGDNTLPDQVAGMKELGAKYPWIDLSRAGIWGHSGGGNATADAMFRYPDFFKVGIAESGNHENRGYEDDWAEKWAGLLVKNADGTSNYDSQANAPLAKNLKGKLMLAHGTMDDNVPPYLTLLVVDALIKANKDFDLVMIPNSHHGYAGASNYMARRRWDYFVTYLMGATPPKEYEMAPYTPPPPRGED